jgi:hypothetical protein
MILMNFVPSTTSESTPLRFLEVLPHEFPEAKRPLGSAHDFRHVFEYISAAQYGDELGELVVGQGFSTDGS